MGHVNIHQPLPNMRQADFFFRGAGIINSHCSFNIVTLQFRKMSSASNVPSIITSIYHKNYKIFEKKLFFELHKAILSMNNVPSLHWKTLTWVKILLIILNKTLYFLLQFLFSHLPSGFSHSSTNPMIPTGTRYFLLAKERKQTPWRRLPLNRI